MSASARVSDSPGISLPKWQVALAIGAPVALVGLGVWYYRSTYKSTSQPSSKKQPGAVKKKGTGIQQNNQPKSTDNSSAASKGASPDQSKHQANGAQVSVEESSDPFRQAQAFKNNGNKQFKEGRYSDAIKCYQQVN